MVRRYLTAMLVIAALAGCTSRVRGHGSAARPTGPQSAFAPLAGVRDDGGDQTINDLAAVGSTVVAVGGDSGGGLDRPIFLRSQDAGRTWQSGTVTVSRPDVRSIGDWAVNVVNYRGTWLCLGRASDRYTEWTSRDGLTWTQRRLDRKAFGPHDVPSGLAVTDRGLVLVGQTTAAGHSSVPQAWTSLDGLIWRRIPRMGRLAVASTDLTVQGVAAHGNVVVAVGESHDEAAGADPEHAVVWRSADTGATWSAVRLPAHFAGPQRSYLNGVRWTGGQFTAVGAGGAGYHDQWAGVVAASGDGREWSVDYSGGVLTSDHSVYLTDVAAAGGQLLVTGDRRAETDVAFAASGGIGAGWVGDDVPLEPGVTASSINRVLAVPGGVLLAGDADPQGSQDARIWRSAGGRRFAPVDLRSALGPDQPVLTISSVATDGMRLISVGACGGVPVTWTSRDGERYGTPTALPHEAHDSVASIAYGPAGWLALGAHDIGSNSEAIAWTSRDGTTWTRSPDHRLGAAAAFADSQLDDAVAYRGGWVLVGSRFKDQSRSAQVYLGAGARWKLGAEAHRGDLRGTDTTDRWMSGVVAAGTALVAVGASGGQPAVWRSSDGTHWRLATLTDPAGGGIDHVIASGSRFVALGTVGARPYAWVSNDAGRRWSRHSLPVARGRTADSVVAVLHVGSTYAAVGAVGPDGQQLAAVWTSPDGAHWRTAKVTDPQLHGAGQRTAVAAVAFGDQVVGVATVVSPESATAIAFTQRLA